jgi:hypothetical protein
VEILETHYAKTVDGLSIANQVGVRLHRPACRLPWSRAGTIADRQESGFSSTRDCRRLGIDDGKTHQPSHKPLARCVRHHCCSAECRLRLIVSSLGKHPAGGYPHQADTG